MDWVGAGELTRQRGHRPEEKGKRKNKPGGKRNKPREKKEGKGGSPEEKLTLEMGALGMDRETNKTEGEGRAEKWGGGEEKENLEGVASFPTPGARVWVRGCRKCGPSGCKKGFK